MAQPPTTRRSQSIMSTASAPEPADTISPVLDDVILQFQTTKEQQSLKTTVELIRETEAIRRDTMNNAHSLLQDLSRKLAVAKANSTRQIVDPQSVNHVDKMIELEGKQYAVAKQIRDMDQEIAAMEAELQGLKARTLGLDVELQQQAITSGVTGEMMTETEAKEQGAINLQLKVFRDLGFDLQEDKRGEFTEIRVRTDNATHIVKLDDKLDPYYRTNLIWDFAS